MKDKVRDAYDVVVADLSDGSEREWDGLKAICRYRPFDPIGPNVVAVSTVRHPAAWRLRAEELGSRWVTMARPDRADLVIEEVDALVAERAQRAAEGPHFVILGSSPPSARNMGGEILAIWMVYHGRFHRLRLSKRAYRLFDFLAEHRWHGWTASQIARDIPVPRTAIALYVDRIRKGLLTMFEKLGMPCNPYQVLKSEKTSSNTVEYQLRGTFEWRHLNRALLRKASTVLKRWPDGVAVRNDGEQR